MRRTGQEGYALLVVLVAFSVFAITMAAALPSVVTQARREREARLIDHGREYRTAIRRYYHKNGRYPASLDVLTQKDGNGIRYLREAWPDPLSLTPATAADSSNSSSMGSSGNTHGWDLIYYGQAVQAEIVDQPPAAASQTAGSTLGGGSAASGITGSGNGGTTSGSTLGSNSGSGSGSGSSTGSGPNSGTPIGGGGPVIGVASGNKDAAIHAFNGFGTPDKWQFVYNFAQDTTLGTGASGGIRTGTPGTGGTSPGGSGTTGGTGGLLGGAGGSGGSMGGGSGHLD